MDVNAAVVQLFSLGKGLNMFILVHLFILICKNCNANNHCFFTAGTFVLYVCLFLACL